MKKLITYLILLITIYSCSSEEENTPDELKIRLSNESQFDFQNVIIDTSTGEVSFGDLSAKQKSSYQVFEKAYRYAYISLEIDGASFTLQPIDYVGEAPLQKGLYTYQLSVNYNQNQIESINLNLVED